MADICGSIVAFAFMLILMIVPMLMMLIPILIVLAIVASIIYAIIRAMSPGSSPGGIFFGAARTDLDSVEAGVVLGINPLRVLGMVVMSLVRKGYLRVKSPSPLRVEVVPATEFDSTHCHSCGAPLDEGATACGYCGVSVAQAESLAYYESAFLQSAMSADGSLDEGGANGVIRMLESQVESKMAGASAEATREYYKKMLNGLWHELESAPDDAKGYAFSKNAGWLALDEEFGGKSEGYSDDKRISRLLGAMKGTVEDSGIDGTKLG